MVTAGVAVYPAPAADTIYVDGDHPVPLALKSEPVPPVKVSGAGGGDEQLPCKKPPNVSTPPEASTPRTLTLGGVEQVPPERVKVSPAVYPDPEETIGDVPPPGQERPMPVTDAVAWAGVGPGVPGGGAAIVNVGKFVPPAVEVKHVDLTLAVRPESTPDPASGGMVESTPVDPESRRGAAADCTAPLP